MVAKMPNLFKTTGESTIRLFMKLDRWCEYQWLWAALWQAFRGFYLFYVISCMPFSFINRTAEEFIYVVSSVDIITVFV